MRAIAGAAGVLGGVCWLVRPLLDGGASDTAWYAGLVLLCAAVLFAGLLLVPRSPIWLHAIVGVGSVALAVSVVAILRDAGDHGTIDAVAGAVAVVLGLPLALSGGRRAPRHHGTHAR